MSTRKLNFDPTIRIGWNKYHCKEYLIPFPMTTCGSKSELKWLRYLENCAERINSLREAIYFDPTIGFPNCQVLWKL